MLANSLRTNLASNGPFDRNTSKPGQAAMLLSLDGHSRARERHDMRTDPRAHRLPNRPRVDAAGHAVEIYPAESRLVDTSNEWNLFCVLGKRVPLGFEQRLVSEHGDDIGSVQRPWESDDRPTDLVYITRDQVIAALKKGE